MYRNIKLHLTCHNQMKEKKGQVLYFSEICNSQADEHD